MISVVGLGPAGLSSVSMHAHEALNKSRKVLIRTKHHPAVAELSDRGVVFETFDHIYETATSFEEVYSRIAEDVLDEAARGDVVYAVPGHPLVGERSVELLIAKAAQRGVSLSIVPSPSFIDACLEVLRVGIDRGLKVLDALEIERLTPSLDTPNLIYQVYDQQAASRVKLRLMEFFPDELEVYVVRAAGSGEEEVTSVPLFKLDWREFDHLTSVYVPERIDEVEE